MPARDVVQRLTATHPVDPEPRRVGWESQAATQDLALACPHTNFGPAGDDPRGPHPGATARTSAPVIARAVRAYGVPLGAGWIREPMDQDAVHRHTYFA